MKKIFRKLHLWLSVPFGIFITLICFSGAMLIFEKEITEMCRNDLYYVKEVKDRPLPIDSLMKTVSATLPDTVSVTNVVISPEPERAWQMSLSKPRRASVYVDQYTGEVKGRSERLAFYDTMFHMHRWMLGSSKGFGKLLVGVSTLLLVIILITGILMWLSNRKKPLLKSMKISFTKGWPRFWHDLHVAGGIYATIFLLALALTGLTWSFSWYRTGFYAMFGVEASAGGHGGHGGGGHDRRAEGGKDGEFHGRKGRGNHDRREETGGEERHRHGHNGDGEGGKWHHDKKVSADKETAKDVRTTAVKQETASAGREKAVEPAENVKPERQDNEKPAYGEDNSGRHYGENGDGYRGRGGRGGRGGRYRHNNDSTGGYAGRHEGDSLHRRGGRRDMAVAGITGDSNGPAASNSGESRSKGGEAATDRHDGKRGGRYGHRDGNWKGRGGKPEAKRHEAARDSSVLTDTDSVVVTEDNPEVSLFANWQKVYEKLAKENPGYRQITISDGSAGVVPAGRNSLRAADRFEFDPASGEITGSKPYSEQEKSAKVRSTVYTVHVGSWGGMLTRIITFLAALLGATLPLTGYYLWIRKMIVKRKNKNQKPKK